MTLIHGNNAGAIRASAGDEPELPGRQGDLFVEEARPELKPPAMYKVVLLNDDYTPMEFIVYVLQTVFNHTHEQSTQIMMAVHTKGKGVCGIFSKEIAEMMSYEVNNMAKHHNHPLLSEIEPLSD